MMAMTPYEKKTLDEIEHAFLEAVEPRVSPSTRVASKTKHAKKKTTPRGGWFSGLKETMVNAFVCCAPPQTLLDDDEILEILAKIEEPVKPIKSTMTPPRTLSRKESLTRRNSASIMPAARAVDTVQTLAKPTLSDITAVLDRSDSIAEEGVPVVEDSKEFEAVAPRAHVSLVAMQRVIVTLLALHKTIDTRQTERAVLAVQMKWRRRHVVTTTSTASIALPTISTAPSIALPTSPIPPTTPTEPDLEPKTCEDHATVSNPKRRRNRKLRCTKKTKFACIPNAATEETAEAVESLTQLALTRKRLRSVDLESCAPRVDVERNVHVLFGEEEIDDDDDEVAELGMILSPIDVAQSSLGFALQRCASVPPPPTAFRPRPIKSKSLIETQVATTIQRAWRNMKTRREHEIQRRLEQYEAEKQSVMPTIRNKMLELRKRLEAIQERNSGAIVAIDEPVLAPVDDDFDWL